ncbi:MAG: helix-turn-helix transcriptional regulator [Micromonosporaceae bacterium]
MVGRAGVSLSPDRLRAARETRGFSQDKLAKAAGCHPKEISAYETGLTRPGPARLKQLADALGADPLDLLEPGIPVTLATLRVRAGLTQSEAAARAEVSRSTWAACERGATRIGQARAERFARALTTDQVETTAEQVARAVGSPARIKFVVELADDLVDDLAEQVEAARRPGETLKDAMTRFIHERLRQGR